MKYLLSNSDIVEFSSNGPGQKYTSPAGVFEFLVLLDSILSMEIEKFTAKNACKKVAKDLDDISHTIRTTFSYVVSTILEGGMMSHITDYIEIVLWEYSHVEKILNKRHSSE